LTSTLIEESTAGTVIVIFVRRGRRRLSLSELVLIRPEAGAAEDRLTSLVLNGVTSPHSRRAYATGLARFFAWLRGRPQPPQAFSKALLQEYRAWLLEQELSPATINLRLSPLRKLAREMADNSLLDSAAAGAIQRTKGVKQQARELLKLFSSACPSTAGTFLTKSPGPPHSAHMLEPEHFVQLGSS